VREIWRLLRTPVPAVDYIVRRSLLVQSAIGSMLTNLMGLMVVVMVKRKRKLRKEE